MNKRRQARVRCLHALVRCFLWSLALHLVALPALAQTVPDPPDNLAAAHETSNPSLIRVALTWDTPDNTGDSPITKACYRYRRISPGPQSFREIRCRTVAQLGGVNRIVTPHLQGGSKYEFNVALHNNAGQGGWTAVWFTPGVSPALTIDPTSVEEDAGATVVTVTVALNSRFTLTRNIDVKVSVGGGTATAGDDYTAVDDFTLTIPAGQLSAKGTFTLTPIDNDVAEGNETVVISGTASDFVTIASATLTILDEAERGLKFSKTAVTVTEASGAGNTATYTVALKSRPTAAVKVVVASNDGNAATVSPDTLRWTAAQWQATRTVTVTGVDDQVDNTPDRTTTISHTAIGGDYGSVTGSVAVTVIDDEGSPAFSVGDASVAEGDSGEADLDFTVTLSPAADMETTVAWATSDGTATAGSDYTAANGTLTFAAGATSMTVTVKVTGDGIDEPNETLTLTLSGATGSAGISTATATGTITDDDDTPTVSLALSPSSISENGGSSTVTAALSGASGEAVTVTVTAAEVSPAVAGDFALSSNTTLTIAAGATSSTGTVTVTANDNNVHEANKTVRVSGAVSGGHGVADPSDATLTITDDEDMPTVSLALSPSSISENGGSSTVTAALSGASGDVVTVTVAATEVSPAVAGDFALSSSTTLTIAAGATSSTGTVTVTANDNDVDAPNKTVTVSGAASGGYGVADPSDATLTITDDDERGLEISKAGVAVTEASGTGNTATYTVALKSRPTAAVKVAVASNDGSAATVSPDTLRWTAAQWEATRTVTVTGVDDQVDNTPDRTATISHTATGGDYGSVTGSVAVTVIDDEGSPAFSVGDASVAEGDSGEADLDFTVTLSPAAGTATTVAWATSDGTATAGSDYTAGSGTLTFAAGATSKTVTVKVTGDGIDEPNETLTLTLSGATGGAGISTTTATGTIIDDDNTPSGTITLSVNPTSVAEAASATTVTVTATLPGTTTRSTATGLTMSVGVSGDAATEGTDYATVSDFTLSIAAGQMSGMATFSIDPIQDAIDEGSGESVSVAGSTSVSGLTVTGTSLIITDDDRPQGLSIAATPACGVTVKDLSLRQSKVLVLTPAPGEVVETEYRVVTRTTTGSWLGALPIELSGRSIRSSFGTFAELRRAYPGFNGFEYRLRDTPTVTARCTWRFDDDGTTSPTPVVSLTASPNPVDEGSSVTVTARLSSVLSNAVTIPLRVTAGTAESGDFGTLASITIAGGSTTGTGTITTSEDADTDDETFTVALGSLPSSVAAGSPRSVRVTIRDDGGGGGGGGGGGTTPTVSLSVAPNPVVEGSSVTVTARLSSALSSRVTIPLTLTNGTAEDGDYGSLSSITVDSGSRTGSGRISTSEDADPDDETFTVALGSLPSSVRPGSPRAVEVTILEHDPQNRAPTVSASCEPCQIGMGGEVRLTATASDPDGDPLTYAWSVPWGDMAGPADKAATRWRAPAKVGRFTMRVWVSDGRGGTASATVSVEVANAPPAFAEPSYTFRLRENEDGRARPVPLGVVLAEDPDGDEVTYALASGAADLFAVGAHDGAVTYVGPGEDYETEPNRYELTVSARDPHGAKARALARVTVEVVNVNELPVAAADTVRTAEDEPVVIDVLANDTDVDGDALRVESVTAPSHGTARIAPGGGGVEYAPGTDWHGTDRFTYTVADGNGGTATTEVQVMVDPVNDAPEAVADTAATAEDEPVVIDVLANDTDIEGDALRVESVTAPTHGTAHAAASGGVEYAPEPDWHGTDRFAYTVTDGNGGTATAEVEVMVEAVNDAPEAVADTVTTVEDQPMVINVVANDTDVEGDALSVESVTAPSHGTARTVASGGVEYAPEADYHGPDRFTYTVTDGNGGTAEAEVVVTVASVNDAPEAVGAIPDQALDEGGGSVALNLAPYFKDRDGDPLSYTAVSSDPGAVAVSVAGSALTLTPVGYGPASIDVMAHDPGGLSAAHTFAVDASDRMVRAALDETLAAMARAHLASARMTLGRRVRPGGGAAESSMLTVMGHRVPLGRDAAREAAGRLLEGWAVSRLWRGGGLAEAGRALEGRMAEWAAAAADGSQHPPDLAELAGALGVGGLGAFPNSSGPGSPTGPTGPGSPTGPGTEWVFAFGGQEASARPGGAWRFWGQGDIQTFAGDPVPERGYEGDLHTGWAGLDRALGERWLVGLAAARSRGGGDWRAGSAGGRLETSLTALHPYLRWSDGATSLWAMAGGGRGSAENARATGRAGASSLDLRLGLFEARRRLTDWLGLRADAAWASLATGAGDETVDGRRAAVHQQRLGIELTPSGRLGGLAIEPFAEASARRDGGAGQTGSGLEVSGGLRAESRSVRIDAQGRILVLHSAQSYEERGLGVTLTVGSPAAEEGLSLSVSPRWGGSANATGALWNDRHGALRPDAPAAATDGPWALDARGRWAVRLPDGRLLAWSGGLTRSALGYAFTIGGGIGLYQANSRSFVTRSW